MWAAQQAEYNKRKTGWLKEPPSTVAIVVTSEDQVIISSSMKSKPKSGMLLYQVAKIKPPANVPKDQKSYAFWDQLKTSLCPAAISEGLQQCEREVGTPGNSAVVGHTNAGNCGEVMAAWAWCDVLGNKPVAAKVVAIIGRVDNEQTRKSIIDPCGGDSLTVGERGPV